MVNLKIFYFYMTFKSSFFVTQLILSVCCISQSNDNLISLRDLRIRFGVAAESQPQHSLRATDFFSLLTYKTERCRFVVLNKQPKTC